MLLGCRVCVGLIITGEKSDSTFELSSSQGQI